MIGGKAQREHFNPKPGDEVWGLNNCYWMWGEGWWTRFFNLHKYENLRRYGYDIERNVDWLLRHPDVKFYTIDTWPELFGAERHHLWDRESIEGSLAPYIRHDYHCGSFDWMVAFALSIPEIDEIVLHGVSLLIEAGEPISARSCLEYWCGVADGMGVNVTCAPDCDLFAFYHLVKSNMIYGYDDTPIFEDRTKPPDGSTPYKVTREVE